MDRNMDLILSAEGYKYNPLRMAELMPYWDQEKIMGIMATDGSHFIISKDFMDFLVAGGAMLPEKKES